MITRDEHCVVAVADALRGSGEILVSPFGVIPPIAARLALLTFEPDIVLTDGEARALRPDGSVEAWFPFRFVFDLLSAGRRHVIMMPVQIDRFGNMNLSCIGDHAKPKVQLIGCRGAPGNTVNHATSYWVPKHTPRAFVETVDFVSGAGVDRGGQPRFVLTNLGSFAFDEGGMRVHSLHPGVSAGEVRENTGFDIDVPDDVARTRDPSEEELRLIREELDPGDRRKTEV